MHKILFKGGEAHLIKEEKDCGALDSLLLDLQAEVELSNTMFSDIWRYIERDAEHYNVIFSNCMGGHLLEKYIEHSKKPAKRREDMDGLELCWFCEYNLDQGLYILPRIHGLGGEHGSWSLCFTPINEWMLYPMSLCTKIKITNIFSNSNTDITNPAVLLEANKRWTVYDMLQGILHEISWYGYPEDQNKEKRRIMKIVDKCRRDSNV